MSAELYGETLNICQRHADRLGWAMDHLRSHVPFTAETLDSLSDMDLAILDQFSTRFAKLQDAMGAKLFPVVLDLTKEPGEAPAFIDKLHRLEKIGAIASADDWLLLREMRNVFSHDYPDDPELQAAGLNKAFRLADGLVSMLEGIKQFSARYL